MRTAVDRVGRGKERQINMRFLAMMNHYVYEPEFRNPAAGWEKGQVEKNVRDSRHQILQRMPDFPDLAALNACLEERYLELWRGPHMANSPAPSPMSGPRSRPSHVATSLGIQANEDHGGKVRFFSAIELVNGHEQEKAKGKTGQIARA